MTGLIYLSENLRLRLINVETHSSPRNLSSLVHDQEASQHCTLSDTHHKSSGWTFVLLENQNLRRDPCESFMRYYFPCAGYK
jgi:hypothetical protein